MTMEKRIYISTNFNRLRRVIGEQRNNRGINHLDNNFLLSWNSINNCFEAGFNPDTDLFLLRDEAYDENNNPIDTLGSTTILATDYLKRHSKYTHSINQFEDRIHSKGQHEENDPIYTRIFELILRENIDIANKIIEFLFPSREGILGKKLELLHTLLVPPVDLNINLKEWKELEEVVKKANEANLNIEINTEAWRKFVLEDINGKASEFNENPFSEEYINALTSLRDALLSS